MTQAYFITGTDTDVGKTLVTCALLEAAATAGYTTAALKPVAAGVADTNMNNEGAELGVQKRQNPDVLLLHRYATAGLSFEQINPVCFEQPVAPHLAAELSGMTIDLSKLVSHCEQTIKQQHDLVLIEGAGGWRVPVNKTQFLSDLVKQLRVPVILVVGLKLGCLNHARLTMESILNDGLELAGWVANEIDPDMALLEHNIVALQNLLQVPMLAHLPRLNAEDMVSQAASLIDFSMLEKS